MKYYKFNPALKEKMLGVWLESQRGYQKKKRIASMLKLAGGAVCAGLFLLMTLGAGRGASGAIPVPVLGLLTGAAFGCIPFFIGQGIGNSAKKEYGRPYCRMTKEFLGIGESGLEFGYNNTESISTVSMDVYRIDFDKINRVRFDREMQILTITGAGSLTAYDDYTAGVINEELSGRKFYSNSDFSFILAFDRQEEIVELLKREQKWED